MKIKKNDFELLLLMLNINEKNLEPYKTGEIKFKNIIDKYFLSGTDVVEVDEEDIMCVLIALYDKYETFLKNRNYYNKIVEKFITIYENIACGTSNLPIGIIRKNILMNKIIYEYQLN